jgi:hypothetical protein
MYKEDHQQPIQFASIGLHNKTFHVQQQDDSNLGMFNLYNRYMPLQMHYTGG